MSSVESIFHGLPNQVHLDRVWTAHADNPVLWSEYTFNSNYRRWSGLSSTIITTLSNDETDVRAIVWNKVYGMRQNRNTVLPYHTNWFALAGAILCLTVYDDCAYMLESDPDELEILAALGDDRAFMLAPARKALFEQYGN